ncbi:alanine--tRNA ligase [Candidatus Gillettellia adelgis]
MSKSTTEIRQTFLDFFCSKGHKVVKSCSLVPDNDPTLLFTNAGMNQFKNIFLGLDTPNYFRATTSQRCVRAGGKHNDLDNVGYTVRHHTFFEMLGNFSFGDYFKYEAISYAWELLTGKDWFNLPKEKLWITVYDADNEAFDIWQKHIGVTAERIIRIGDNKGAAFASDNFWQMGDTGPCGPCTEIFYDHGDHIWGGPPGSDTENGDRYIEIWNIVFMQFDRQSDHTMQLLPKPSVDTGMGLERIAGVLQHVHDNYEIDLFRTLIASIANVTGASNLANKSLRVIADHIRSCAFLISDGVLPSNENRGYVLRRIIRRAIRHGNMLGVKNTFLYRLVAPLIQVMGASADSLKHQQLLVEHILKSEEKQFARTLDRGLSLLNQELSRLNDKILDGKMAFYLYDTCGFPIDLTSEICRERGLKVDEDGFNQAMREQQHRARKQSSFRKHYNTMIRTNKKSQFIGYDHAEQQATVIALFCDGRQVKQINAGENTIVILDKTPFYGEAGGQVGDQGVLKVPYADFIVRDTQKYRQAIGHHGKLLEGSLKVKDRVNAYVDTERRNDICLNHSATHLLHAALRKTLGAHVMQKGSLVNNKYLRFDFSHFETIKPEQIRAIETLVNQQVRRNLLIQSSIMPLSAAKEKGAIALFHEKYDNNVRVLSIGDFSIELCSGTHSDRTGNIGLFRIVTEFGIAAGVRRIEATTGEHAITILHQQTELLQIISDLVKSNTTNLANKVQVILNRTHILEKELQKFRNQQVAQETIFLSSQAKIVKGVQLVVSRLNIVNVKVLRTIVENLKNQLGSAVIVLAMTTNNKVYLIAGVTKDLMNRVKAGELISDMARQIDGKGGGRPDIAQAAGTNVSALSQALNSVEDWVMSML